ncbi:hypothetical protein TNCV_1003711 [Trichonephila clavipes]|nr:hypothetical protein TNCV_1003711 [Trichonephila clavipes]
MDHERGLETDVVPVESWFRVLMPLKTRHAERHIESETALSSNAKLPTEEHQKEKRKKTACPKPLRDNFFAHPVQWLATLTAVPLGLGSNPGEDMDVCKCIVPSRHGGTLNSRRAISLLVRLVEEKESGIRTQAQDSTRVIVVSGAERNNVGHTSKRGDYSSTAFIYFYRVSESKLTSHCPATRGLLVTDLVILNHGQVTRTTLELEPLTPNYHTNGRTFELSTDLRCIAPLHVGLAALGFEPTTRQPQLRFRNHNHPTTTSFSPMSLEANPRVEYHHSLIYFRQPLYDEEYHCCSRKGDCVFFAVPTIVAKQTVLNLKNYSIHIADLSDSCLSGSTEKAVFDLKALMEYITLFVGITDHHNVPNGPSLVTTTPPELTPLIQTTTPHQREAFQPRQSLMGKPSSISTSIKVDLQRGTRA